MRDSPSLDVLTQNNTGDSLSVGTGVLCACEPNRDVSKILESNMFTRYTRQVRILKGRRDVAKLTLTPPVAGILNLR